MSDALLLVSDREPLAWLLREQRFAIPAKRASSAPLPNTRLFIYTTRSCFRNPGRDRGRVIGKAVVTGPAEPLDEPVQFRGREFTQGFSVRITSVAPVHAGVELAPMAGHLDALPDEATWMARMRRSLLPLSPRDAKEIDSQLAPLLIPLLEARDAYLTACKVGSLR